MSEPRDDVEELISPFGDELKAYNVSASPDDEHVIGFRKHVLVCRDPRGCMEKGGFEVKRRFFELLDEDEFYDVKVSTVNSMGYCDRGPVAVVYPDNVWYDDLSPEDVPRIVDEHIRNDEPVDDLGFDPDLPDDFNHFIVCTFMANCGLEGGGKVLRYFRDRQEEDDNPHVKVTQSNGCLKECSMGPVCSVYPSGDWYAGVHEKKMEDIWTSHVDRYEASKHRSGSISER